MKRVIRLGIVIILVSAAVISQLPARSVQAQGDVDTTRRIVHQWLLDTLEKPYLILVEYTYAGASWDNSSLGCPAQGERYTEGAYSGYSWTFTFDNFVRYEVHSGLFGDPVMLCSATNIAANIPLSVYAAPAFDVLVPESWLTFASSDKSDVSFGPGTSIPCEQAGMRVLVSGVVETGVTPDDLLDDYLSDKTVPDESRIAAGSFGRSSLYELACGEIASQGRITMIVESGVAYRIEQWAAQDEFADWDTLFQNILSQFTTKPIALVTPTPDIPDPTITPTPAPTNTGVPLEGVPPESASGTTPTEAADAATATPDATEVADAAAAQAATDTLAALPIAHIFLGDLFIGTLNKLPGLSITMTPEEDRRYLHFAPNGRMLLYTDLTSGQIRAMDAGSDLSPRKIADGVYADFPPAWSPDSTEVVYVVDTGERDGDAALLAAYRVNRRGGEPTLVGGFAYRDGCELAVSDPADAVLIRETGISANANALVWLSDNRLLLSTGCAGGLAVLMPDEQQIIELGDDLHGGVIAPDRQQFLARTDTGLAVLDFNQWERRNISLGTPPQQIAWGLDGQSIYYATATRTDTVTLDDDARATTGSTVFGTWPVTVHVYALTLIQLDLRNDQPSVIWQGRGRGIGRIEPAPDASGVLFTLVPSSLPLVEVFNSNGDAMAINEAQPRPVMYWLPTGSESARLLAYTGQPVFGAQTLLDQASGAAE